jgi:murein DD-endopeptidase MepM/ murein hydrolase activator NlpD
MIKHDYRPQNKQKLLKSLFLDRLPAWSNHPYVIISTAVVIIVLAILLFKDKQTSIDSPAKKAVINKPTEKDQSPTQLRSNTELDKQNNTPNTIQKPINYSAPVDIPLEISSNSQETKPLKLIDTTSKWMSVSVGKGDNLSLIFKRIGLSPQAVHKIITLDKNSKLLKNLKPGEAISYQLDKNNQLLVLKYTIDLQNTLLISRSNLSSNKLEYKSEIIIKTIELRTAYISGIITDSLFMSGKRAGLTDTLVINLANIFDWDIDFILDIRKGDSFSVLYQEKYLEGEMIGNGDIIAAEFINQGDAYKAVRYKDSKDNVSYYTPNGLSMRKAFLRAPIKFSYISSGFKLRRFHPIQKRWKAHRGIDYRAKTGTPIRAAGDGKIISSSYNKFNGKYVFIQHGQGIVTKYLHMSKRAVSRGKRVKQGQVIGYVGTTGMSEAPHLHYEFLVNGIHRNPRTVKLPKAHPISKKEKSNFLLTTKDLVTQLETRKQIQSTGQVAK